MAELDPAVVTERVLRLKHGRPFDAIPASELERLAAAGREVVCSTRTTLVSEGERAAAHWVALTGRLRAVRPAGVPFPGDRIEDGFGGLSILGDRAMPCEVVAEPGSVLLVLDADNLFALLDESGALARSFLRAMAAAIIEYRGRAERPAPASLSGANVAPEGLDVVTRVVLLREALGLSSRSIPVLVRLSRAARVERTAPRSALWDPTRSPADLVTLPRLDGEGRAVSGRAFGLVESVAGVAMRGQATAAEELTRLVVAASEIQEVIEDDDRFCLELLRLFAGELWEEFWGTT
jgi:CRP-like cAMP-binding protein